jgi:hypothetical protein
MNFDILVSKLKTLVRRTVTDMLSNLHTSMPAQVVSYDGDTNTVSIQPCIQRIRTNDPNAESVNMPQIDDVPVLQNGNGKFWLSVAPQPDSYDTSNCRW